MPPLRIQNPQLRVAIEVRQSVTFNNLTNSISKKRGRASREIVHPQPGRASGCLSPVRAKRAVRCFGAQTFFFFFFNESNSREADFSRSTGRSVCAAGVRDEDVGGGYEGGRGEQKRGREGRGMSPTLRMWWEGKELRDERGDNNHKKFGRTYLSNRPPRSSCLA